MGAPHDFVRGVFDALWEGYRERVSYARAYEKLVARHGGAFEGFLGGQATRLFEMTRRKG